MSDFLEFFGQQKLRKRTDLRDLQTDREILEYLSTFRCVTNESGRMH